MASFKLCSVAAALVSVASLASAGASGSGVTTRYWDCCKPSCAWSGKSPAISNPVGTCDIHDQPLSDPNAASGCGGGTAFTCSSQTPWAVNDNLAYGYAAVNIAGGSESSWCCACYKLTFTSTSIAGKTMIVQATNTGGDLGSNQFDLAIPGGGVGIFNGCTAEWNAPVGGWGAQYGGVSSASACSSLPAALQPGCNFRFGWMQGADNPTVNFEQVACPAEITAKTGCARSDDSSEPSPGVAAGSVGNAVSSAGSNTTPQSSPSAATTLSTVAAPQSSTTDSCGGGAPLYGQCGGETWTGPTSCAQGTCHFQNPWYSQCLN